jgi:D-alanyl-D-alanine carboxypeptidase
LFDKDQIIKEYRYGFADIFENINVITQTTYNAFSVTKTFSALAILQLAEQRIIDIKQPVKSIYQAFHMHLNGNTYLPMPVEVAVFIFI